MPQASERIGAAGGKAEAALFGVLAGNPERVLPLCASWEDAAWTLARRCASLGRASLWSLLVCQTSRLLACTGGRWQKD